VRKLIALAAVGVVAAGVASLALERAGAYSCPCYPECWCKRPGLNLFRWIIRRGHAGPWDPKARARHEGMVGSTS
jgi:hypothetical protein